MRFWCPCLRHSNGPRLAHMTRLLLLQLDPVWACRAKGLCMTAELHRHCVMCLALVVYAVPLLLQRLWAKCAVPGVCRWLLCAAA